MKSTPFPWLFYVRWLPLLACKPFRCAASSRVR